MKYILKRILDYVSATQKSAAITPSHDGYVTLAQADSAMSCSKLTVLKITAYSPDTLFRATWASKLVALLPCSYLSLVLWTSHQCGWKKASPALISPLPTSVHKALMFRSHNKGEKIEMV